MIASLLIAKTATQAQFDAQALEEQLNMHNAYLISIASQSLV